jgi:hypothetical protein
MYSINDYLRKSDAGWTVPATVITKKSFFC